MRILITGGSGALGSAAIPYYLKRGFFIFLLLRAKDSKDLEVRKKEILKFIEPEAREIGLDSTLGLSRVEAISGDITQKHFGQSLDFFKTLELTHILHAAASVDLDMSLEKSLELSLGAVQNLMGLAEGLGYPSLDVVSTVGVNGKRIQDLLERPQLEKRDFFNTYEAGKARAEEFLYTYLDQGRSLRIHRPSMVVGSAKTGRVIHFQVFYFLTRLISGEFTRGILPDLSELRLDLIPNDLVGEFLARTSEANEGPGIYNLCSGYEASAPVGDLRILYREARLRNGLDEGPRISVAPSLVFEITSLLRLIPGISDKTKKRLSLLPQFLDYASQKQVFDNSQFLLKLKSFDQSLPTYSEYLPKVYNHWLKS